MTNQTQSPLGNAPPWYLNPRNMQTKKFRMFVFLEILQDKNRLEDSRKKLVACARAVRVGASVWWGWTSYGRGKMETQRYHLMTSYDNRSWNEDIVRKNVEKQNHLECVETSSLPVFRNPVARPGLPKNRPTFGRRQGRGALANAELVEGSRKLTALGGYCRFDSWQAWSRKREAWRILMSTTTWLAS